VTTTRSERHVRRQRQSTYRSHVADTDWVRFRDPQIGTTAHQIAERCNWQIRNDSAGLRVCTSENYTKSSPKMLELTLLVSADGPHETAFSDVAAWGHDDLYAEVVQGIDLQRELDRLTESGSREGGWAAHSLLCAALEPSLMPNHLKVAFGALSVPDLFPQISLWSVRETPAASYRNQIVRSLIAAQHLPDVVPLVKDGLSIGMSTGLGAVRTGIPIGERISPLLASAAPWIMGFVSERIGGAIVFMLGKLEFGKSTRLAHSDLIDQLQPRLFGNTGLMTRSQPAFAGEQAVEALNWWVHGLNSLTAVELDPATHQNSGEYDPVRQLAMSVTIDRLVATVQQISIADRRNPMVRKMLFFDSLDLIEGLMPGHSFDVLSSAAKARKQLDELERVMPAGVQEVVLPRCRAAVAALEEMRAGFWVPSTMTNRGVAIPRPAGGNFELTFDTAVSRVLRMIRNGHHGYVSEKFHADFEDRTMLMIHDGEIPAALPDLAYFHLVRLIAFAVLLDPQRLRSRRR
jgi:hypothetical protein